MLSPMKTRLAFLVMLCAQLTFSEVNAMTFEEERKISQEVITSLEAQDVIVYDQEVTNPVKLMTERLSDHVKNPIYAFTVHVIMDKSINAFTIPDGHIFLNIGTILYARDMDEIAAVTAHEIAHAQQRHIPQTMDAQKEITAASLIGVILGAVASMKNPEAGAALIFSSLGGSENIKLAYSRRHEHDADDFSRGLLGLSGYDTTAMNRFLSRMNIVSGTSKIPEYLLTHPSAPSRISGESPDSQKPKPDADYWTLQACVIGVLLPEDEAMQRIPSLPDPYRKLSLGMLETRRGGHEKALDLLKDIDLPLAHAYRGLNLSMTGRKDEAYPLLKQYGGFARAQLALAGIMEEKGEFKQAVSVLTPYQKQNINVDYKLGILQEKAGMTAASHVSFARYFFKTGKSKATLYHVDKALEQKTDLNAGIEDELKQMKDFMKKQEERQQ